MSELKPKHTHDCEDCHFLGSFSYATTDSLDLYRCGKGPYSTLISRYGSRGEEYSSFDRETVERCSSDSSFVWSKSMMGLPVALLLVKQIERIDHNGQ